jgi:hypothetical protein
MNELHNVKGILRLSFEPYDTSYLKISIFDDGQGFDINQENKSKTDHAINIIRERLTLLKQDQKENLSSISFMHKEDGFESIIILPITKQ